MKFTDIKLNKNIHDAIRKAKYEDMTPIQEKAIPAMLEGRDMIACAQTGTGKTAAFALPILDELAGETGMHPRALILTPTRELAQQIFENCKNYGRYLKLRTACLYGGASSYQQMMNYKKGCDILIACPGRLLDFLSQGIVRLDKVSVFVLDEADRMLDMGFIPDIRKIVKIIPAEHQTAMFSATMPKEIEKLAKELLKSPVDIRIKAESTPADTVEQKICFVKREDKKVLLKELLGREGVKKSIVFTRTKHGADRLVKDLAKEGINSLAIHGDKTQGQRQNALERFRSGNVKILVATDVASRGIDISNVTHVINFDLPEEAESYVHRIGRAGRAGKSGEAFTICTEDDMGLLCDIEKIMKKEIPEEMTEWTVEVQRVTSNKNFKRAKGNSGSSRRPRNNRDFAKKRIQKRAKAGGAQKVS